MVLSAVTARHGIGGLQIATVMAGLILLAMGLTRLGSMPFMDMTGLQTLEAVIVTLQKRGVAVVVAEANERVREKLARAGVLAALGEGNYADSLAQAVRRCGELAGEDKGEGKAPR